LRCGPACRLGGHRFDVGTICEFVATLLAHSFDDLDGLTILDNGICLLAGQTQDITRQKVNFRQQRLRP
jgi:hypothetical protein